MLILITKFNQLKLCKNTKGNIFQSTKGETNENNRCPKCDYSWNIYVYQGKTINNMQYKCPIYLHLKQKWEFLKVGMFQLLEYNDVKKAMKVYSLDPKACILLCAEQN